MTLSSQVVYLCGIDLADDEHQVGGICEISIVQEHAYHMSMNLNIELNRFTFIFFVQNR